MPDGMLLASPAKAQMCRGGAAQLARALITDIEGHGGAVRCGVEPREILIEGGRVEDVKLKIFEPPRFFEAFLRGRPFTEAPDITARICGICPVAYQMSAVHALEAACQVQVGGPLRALRRDLAREAGVPPYVVFHDSVLREMAAARPSSLTELGQIGGVGSRKLEAYGDRFLEVLREF